MHSHEKGAIVFLIQTQIVWYQWGQSSHWTHLYHILPHTGNFVPTWWWVFHNASQQVVGHCQYLWTIRMTPRSGNVMDKVGIKSKLVKIVKSIVWKLAAMALLFFFAYFGPVPCFSERQLLLFSWLTHDEWGVIQDTRRDEDIKQVMNTVLVSLGLLGLIGLN